MSLYITSLNSGSNGNCYYIGNDNEAVLVDAGISCRETEKRMDRLGLKMEKVKAIFISHEHGDHIRGLEGLTAKYKLPVYITAATLQKSRLRLPVAHIHPFRALEAVPVGGLAVVPFLKMHDAIDPHSFVIEGNGVKIGVFTDIGTVCGQVQAHFTQCHAVFLEANYDEAMLEQGRYPHHLKRRITGGEGHLSNKQALGLFINHRPERMTHLMLAHLSGDNNNPELVHHLFASQAKNTNITVASRHHEMPITHIVAQPTQTIVKKRVAHLQQMALF